MKDFGGRARTLLSNVAPDARAWRRGRRRRWELDHSEECDERFVDELYAEEERMREEGDEDKSPTSRGEFIGS